MIKKKLIIIGIMILIMGGFFYYKYLEKERHRFKVVFMDVGQGDASLIQFESGEKMLIDCGPNSGILSALSRNTVFYDRTIDFLLVTHPDLDHYGGCIDVLKRYQVKKILINGRQKISDPYFEEWKRLSKGYPTSEVGVSTTLAISSSTFQFFSPDSSLVFKNKISDNDYSIVFKLQHNQQSFLFTGDMEEALEKLLVEKYCTAGRSGSCPLRSNILKVGHHGSDSSSSEVFLSVVAPKLAVISVGKNKFGHPSLRAIRHLYRVNTEMFRTDKTGDFVFTGQ